LTVGLKQGFFYPENFKGGEEMARFNVDFYLTKKGQKIFEKEFKKRSPDKMTKRDLLKLWKKSLDNVIDISIWYGSKKGVKKNGNV